MNIVKSISKGNDGKKKDLTTQANALIGAVDQRKTLHDNINKDFIGILRMKYEMESAYMKSMEKIKRVCQEKIDKYTNNEENASSSSSIIFHFIRAYGVSLQLRNDTSVDYLKFLSEFIEFMSNGLDFINQYSTEKTKENIQQLFKELTLQNQSCNESAKNYRSAFIEFYERFDKYTNQKNKKLTKSTSIASRDAKLNKMQGRMQLFKDKLIDTRFTYMNEYEQLNNLTSLLENEQQNELSFEEKLQYESFSKSGVEAYFKKEDDYLLKARYCASGCLTEVLSIEEEYTLPFPTQPSLNYESVSNFETLLLPKDNFNKIFEESYDVISKTTDFSDFQAESIGTLDRRSHRLKKISLSVDKWLEYCQTFSSSEVPQWAKTSKILQDNTLFEDSRVFFHLTQAYIKSKTYEYLVGCAKQKKSVMTIKNVVETRAKKDFLLDLDDCDKNEDGVPVIISTCFNYVFEKGLTSKGIFRISVAIPTVAALATKLSNGEDIPPDTEVHVVASLIKQLVRGLFGFVTESSTKILTNDKQFNNSTSFEKFKVCCKFLDSLKQSSRVLFFFLLKTLKKLSKSAEQTLMTVFNLAIVFQPNIFKMENDLDVHNITLLNIIYTFMIDNTVEMIICYEQYKNGELPTEDSLRNAPIENDSDTPVSVGVDLVASDKSIENITDNEKVPSETNSKNENDSGL